MRNKNTRSPLMMPSCPHNFLQQRQHHYPSPQSASPSLESKHIVACVRQVRDDGPGPGCSEEEMEELFEPFYSYHLVASNPMSGVSPRSSQLQDRRAMSQRLRATYE
jgi:hypothetical protein